MRNGMIFMVMLLAAQLACAESNKYISGAMQVGFFEATGTSRMEPTSIQLKYGAEFSQHGAVELHYLTGIAAGEVRKGTVKTEVDVDQGVSLFLRGNLPMSESARLYGLIGYTDLSMSAEATNGVDTNKAENSDAGASFGFGFEHRKPQSNMSINFEYILYLNETDYDFTGFNLGLSHHF